MVPRHLRRDDPLALPSASGIGSSVRTASSLRPSDSTLLYDHGVSTDYSGASFSITTSTTTSSSSSIPTTSSDSATDSIPTTVAASSAKPIALSTVIGSCVGAFIAMTAFIVFSFWVYRRYSKSFDKPPKFRGQLHRRNVQANEQQRRSRVGIWDKIEEHNDDKWEEAYHTRESKHSGSADITPMERLTMFKKTPSVRTAYTHKSTDASNFSYPATYAEFDPGLAASLKTSNFGPQPVLKDTGPISWSESNNSHSSGSVSLQRNVAMHTSPQTVSYPHRWEAAEVVNFPEAQTAEVINPFREDEDDDLVNTIHNPFFSAKDYAPSRSKSTKSITQTRSRANSTNTQSTVTPSSKTRALQSINPFDDRDDDDSTMELPLPSFTKHGTTISLSSLDDDEDRQRAFKSLVAALEMPEDEVDERLRIASIQASMLSGTSSISEDVTNEFPLPPSMAI